MERRFAGVTLGSVHAGPIALASSYGLEGRDVERAFERGIGFFFWGALRRAGFGAAVRRLARRDRARVTIAIQSYARRPWLLRPSVDLARLQLGVDAIDVLGLGFWSVPPPRALVDAALRLRDRGVVRSVVVSSHERGTLAALLADASFDGVMVRYNAAHLGAEEHVLPLALERRRPVLAYTATRWGSLLVAPASGEPAPRGADCYRFALSHPAVGACLAGPKDAAELDGALEALARGPMAADELAWMRRVGAEVRAKGRMRAKSAMGARDVWGHAKGIARELWERGVTEDLLSRFNR
jgi:aryl-alcohol dehydrogenase-like predicted oxidoreductase